MDKKEKTLSSTTIYKGKILSLRKDEVLCPNGNKSYREIVDHHGGAGILAFIDNKVILIKQYRYTYDEILYEIPAGKLEKDEDPLNAAQRELLEETGYYSSNIKHLGDIYPTCGYSNEIIHIYLAKDLKKQERHLDDDEFIDVYYFDIEEVKSLIKEGKIKDAKTICAIQYYLSL